MFGKQCVSVVVDSITAGLSMITRDVFDEGDEDLMAEWIELIKETKHDQLGHGYVLYWPEVGV